MNTLKAVIVDDEPRGADNLRILISEFCPGIEVLEVCTDPRKSIGIIQYLQPDVVFLDIEMPQIDGFQVLEGIRNWVSHVIFTTAHSHYAIQAVRADAFDYLLKPIDPDDLIRAVGRLSLPASEKQLPKTAGRPSFRRLAIQTMEGYVMVNYDDIIRLEADSNYTHIHCAQKTYLVSKSLAHFEAQLEQEGFVRVHSSHLVNIIHIKHYQRGDGGYLQMSDGAQVEVSRNRKKDLLKILLGE